MLNNIFTKELPMSTKSTRGHRSLVSTALIGTTLALAASCGSSQETRPTADKTEVRKMVARNQETQTSGTRRDVRFPNGAITMAANLYVPAGFDARTKYPAIVVVHPAGGVKEQTAGLYAQRLAEMGFVTLAFDASYQG